MQRLWMDDVKVEGLRDHDVEVAMRSDPQTASTTNLSSFVVVSKFRPCCKLKPQAYLRKHSVVRRYCL